jgi:thermostable 8-oxoguanine DNA glycosylase
LGSISDTELERFLLFSIAVAGKTAWMIEKAMDAFLGDAKQPFAEVRRLVKQRRLRSRLKQARMGQYAKITRGFKEVAFSGLDLRTCTPDDLMTIHGIGPKTARFFLLYTRKDARYAVLDTHILAFLREAGHKVPKTTPQGAKRYAELEALVLKIADEQGVRPADFDTAIWMSRARRNPNTGRANPGVPEL